MTDAIRQRRLERLRREREYEERKAARESEEKRLEARERERRRRNERVAQICLIVVVVAIGFLVFYFRSAIKNAAIAFFNLPFLYDSKFWGWVLGIFGILILLGGIVFILVAWGKLFGLAGETVKDVAKIATTQSSQPIPSSHIYTHEGTGTVVQYEFRTRSIAGYLGKQLVVESRIEKILDADPSERIENYERTLGIKVISQNKGSRRSKGGIYT